MEMKKKKYAYSVSELCRRLIKIASPYKTYIICSALFGIIGNLSHMGLMGFGAAYIMACAGIFNFPGKYFIGLIISAIAIPLCRYLEGYISHVGAYNLLAAMRIKLFNSIRRIAPACMVDRESGDIINVAVSDIETIEYFFAHAIGSVFTVILLPCITLIYAGRYNIRYVLLLAPVYIVTIVIIPLIAMNTGREPGIRYRESLGKLKAVVLEGVYGLKDIQIFGYGDSYLKKVMKSNEAVNVQSKKIIFQRQLLSASPDIFVNIARILVVAIAFDTAADSGDFAGAVILSCILVASFSSTFSLTAVVNSLLGTFGAAERIFLIEDMVPAVSDTEDPVELGRIESIQYKNVTFSYNTVGKCILKEADLKIKRGEKIGIVGESGAGKSTILRLLLRFWKPDSGEILINEESIDRYRINDLRSKIAMLEQSTFLFNSSIAENIAFARPDASPEEIKEAAKRAEIHDFIMTLPDGYDTNMGEMSSRVSGGERQRIGIARLMLLNPDVIVMDEPTASLDALHEKELLKTIDEVYKDKILIIISHRLSTLGGCNRIVRLENKQMK